MARLILLIAVQCGLAACTMLRPVAETGPPEPQPASAASDPLGAAVAVTAAPDYCQLLLENLDEVRPYFESLDSRLGAHAERIEAVVATLDEPAPEPEPFECPETVETIAGDKEVVGSIEWIWMDPLSENFRARIDSGSETSSLSATDVIEFERDGEDWARFRFEHDDADEPMEPVEVELPIVRTVLIRQPSVEELDRRVVVEMDIRMGNRLHPTEFTLTDRSQMTYPVVLGRAFLRDLYLVDVAQSFTHPRYEAP